MCVEYVTVGHLCSVCALITVYVCWVCILNVCIYLMYLGNAHNGYVFTHAFVLRMGVTETYSRSILRTPGSMCRAIVGNSLGWDRGAVVL